ncbi:CynX/NimT family MFS transporter [Pseudomonas chlororaphis]|uniref:Cyanate transport protein CynX n=1 Tax=Pseudomonas chlororaphis TaxID=587753 RepID=A0AAX3G1K5_9PSED|nr:CynX/NimT family MFS transporter [Pseudomonas chlororaphis]AZC34656.1 Cyanate transport protein CynX [Pseudomonas chlororaphis subsp. piscium]AZC41194.1 Cyanate transport protein CynX [Pseudomonas chlororaphis subsp. piscium]NNB47004.1 CynX/NimT family MFS transporter [Pseudomonas chlororaphis]WDG73199.1 CynX/NimT family MFS transporter [Pseudomonas chlororaphis]WDH71721.1 CynX/NimT family MFS transporter [Pseudomonas chlororaphis]
MPLAESRLRRLGGWALLIALGLNLRPIISSISPLLMEIRGATGMSFQSSAWLTSLPVVCMGLVALLGVRLEARLGERRGVALGLLMILCACLARLLCDQASALLATALLGGAGVALIQALVPALIKRQFQQRVALAMGIYSASLMGGGGLAALLSPHVATHFAHWQAGLGVWLLPALAALLLWWLLPFAGPGQRLNAPSISLWRNRRAWLLALYFGLINCGYMSMVAWLPAYYLQLGWSATQSGSLLAFMTIFQVIAALLMPALAQRQSDRRPLLAISLSAQALGFSGLVLWPLQAPQLWVALIGFGLGACFALSLILTLDHRRDPREAGQLAAFVQGVGFLINAVSPWMTGWLRELTGSFISAWWVLILTVLAMLVLTRVFSPSSYRESQSTTLAPQPIPTGSTSTSA